jgi:hypothetical protein
VTIFKIVSYLSKDSESILIDMILKGMKLNMCVWLKQSTESKRDKR